MDIAEEFVDAIRRRILENRQIPRGLLNKVRQWDKSIFPHVEMIYKRVQKYLRESRLGGCQEMLKALEDPMNLRELEIGKDHKEWLRRCKPYTTAFPYSPITHELLENKLTKDSLEQLCSIWAWEVMGYSHNLVSIWEIESLFDCSLDLSPPIEIECRHCGAGIIL